MAEPAAGSGTVPNSALLRCGGIGVSTSCSRLVRASSAIIRKPLKHIPGASHVCSNPVPESVLSLPADNPREHLGQACVLEQRPNQFNNPQASSGTGAVVLQPNNRSSIVGVTEKVVSAATQSKPFLSTGSGHPAKGGALGPAISASSEEGLVPSSATDHPAICAPGLALCVATKTFLSQSRPSTSGSGWEEEGNPGVLLCSQQPFWGLFSTQQ